MTIKKMETNHETEKKALERGFTPLQAIILGNRLTLEIDDFLHRHDNELPSPYSFKDANLAINALAEAINGREKIWLVSDFDNDGVGAMAASFYLLTKVIGYPEDLIRVQVTKRSDGYGLTKKAIDLMLKETDEETRPDILVTMDIGSSNGEEAKYLQSKCPDMQVVITDHHDVPPKGFPENITAFVNPNKPGCNYPDKTICGAAVVFFILDGVRIKLESEGLKTLTSPYNALSYVASSTVADAVSIESPLNRFIVKYGVQLMNNGIFPAWVTLKNKMERTEEISEITLGWLLGPMINATSRLGDGLDAPFRFLSASTGLVASHNLDRMEEVNAKRKEIQNQLYKDARIEAESQKDNACLVIKLNEKFPGIGGVVAGRLMEDYKKPVFVLMPSEPGVITGSARAPSEYFVLEYLRSLPEGTMIKFGGHKSVAGISLLEEKFELFKTLINEAIKSSGVKVSRQTLYDIEKEGMPTPEDFYELRALAPYGMRFPQPVFAAFGDIEDIENISKKTDAHKRILFREQGSNQIIKINYFNAPPSLDDTLNAIAYNVGENHFRGRKTIQLTVAGT